MPALSDTDYDIAIIGAGIAGCFCARLLAQHGLRVALVEKSRGTGGRASSRRLAQSDNAAATTVELGAPFFHAEDDSLATEIERWLNDDIIAPWPEADRRDASGRTIRAYTGVPKMSALTRYLSSAADLYPGQRIYHVDKTGGEQWLLRDENYNALLTARKLILTAPAAQSAALLCSPDAPAKWLAAAHSASQRCSAQWAAVITVANTGEAAETALALLNNLNDVNYPEHPHIERIIKDCAKPSRATEPMRWVIQADQSWSEANKDASAETVAKALFRAFIEACQLPENAEGCIAISNCHRWRLGRHQCAEKTAGDTEENALWDADLRLGIAADWLADGSIWGALQSASALSDQILANP